MATRRRPCGAWPTSWERGFVLPPSPKKERGGEVRAAWDLRCGDCLDPVTGLASLGDKSVDHVITDPPYDEHTHGAQRRGSATTGRGQQFGLSTTTISVERHVGFAALSEKATAVLAAQFARLSRRWSLAFCAMEQQRAWM